MTQPEDDLTELSARNKEAEDVTVLSARERPALSAPSTPEAPDAPHAGDDEEADITRMSSRSHAPEEETADVTRLSQRAGAASAPARPASGRKTRADVAPGAPAADAQRGIFGQPASEYEPRELPESDAPLSPEPIKPTPPSPTTGQNPIQARSRKEAARHRRLLTAVVIVGVTAAVMTAAVLGIMAMLRGEG